MPFGVSKIDLDGLAPQD